MYIGGSYNFTMDAEKNNEKHMFAARSPGTCKLYLGWFYGLWMDVKAFDVEKGALVTQAAKSLERSRSRASARKK